MRNPWAAYFFILPGFCLLFLLLVVPLFYCVVLSFSQVTFADLTTSSFQFVGLANFRELASDQSFYHSIKLLVLFIVISTSIEVILALLVAYLADQVFKVKEWAQSLLLLPMFVIPVVAGLTFRYLFDPLDGVIGKLYAIFNLEAPDMLGDPTNAFIAILIQDIWRMWPFLFLIILAGFKGIPSDQIKAIKLDGANHWQTFRYVILPGLVPTLIIAIILKVIESIKVFTEIYVMTGGGPGESTSILSLYIVKQLMEFGNYGKSAAAASPLIGAGIALTLVLAFVAKASRKVPA